MGNKGFLELGLIDVRGRPAADTGTTVAFFHAPDGRPISRSRKLEFPPNRRFELPAFPQSRFLSFEITPARYRIRKSDFFGLTHNETVIRNLTVVRRPDQWKALFTPWDELPGHFDALKRVLEKSPSLRVKGGKNLGQFAGGRYGEHDRDQRIMMAKASMLNLFFKLSDLAAPAARNRKWFSFVREIIEIGRERFIAIVDPKMGEIVRAIKSDIKRFEDYKHTPAENHFNNFPKRYSVFKSKLFSIKSDEKNANIQLTLGPGTDADGNEVLLLDADIDENGQALRHLADVFKHKFTGGTHPFDIHEFLLLAHDQAELGYTLV